MKEPGRFENYDYVPFEIIVGATQGNWECILIIRDRFDSYLNVVLRNDIHKREIQICRDQYEDIRAAVLDKFTDSVRSFRIRKRKEKETEKMFDSFCKKILPHIIRDEVDSFERYSRFIISYSPYDLERIERFYTMPEITEFSKIRLANGIIFLKNDRLSEALENLRPAYQKVIYLSYFLDFPDKEIAKKMNLSIASVYEYKYEAIYALRNTLADMNF